MATKKCIKCNEKKDINEFYEDKRTKDKYENICMNCANDIFHISNIYIIEGNNAYKVGESKNPNKRLKQLQTGNPCRLKLIKVYENLEYGKIIEKILHEKLDFCNVDGEWFQCDLEKICKIIDNTLERLNSYDAWKYYKTGTKSERHYLKIQREFNL